MPAKAQVQGDYPFGAYAAADRERTEQVFEPTRPNEVWTGDITYITTDEGWLYLAGLKDVFTCEIVGYAMAERMTTELVSLALFRAVRHGDVDVSKGELLR